MKVLVRGKIANFVPTFTGYLNKGVLDIGNANEDLSLTVDTGFSGGIALPQKILNKMKIEFFGYDTFTLATGEVTELPMFLGKVIVGTHEIKTWFIPGDSLLGMEFLSATGSLLLLNFKNQTVQLAK
jgi:predicted aspartyl protease